MLQDLGEHCMLFKMDLKSAFRLLPVQLADIELLGFKFLDKYYIDKCLPFGCSISCSHFEKFSTFLECYIRHTMASGMLIHYLDDFLGGDKTLAGCAAAMDCFRECMSWLSVPLAEDKTEGPSEVLVFLGLELDSNNMVVRIPKEKITEVIQKIKLVLGSRKTTVREMQSLIGSLNFCCRAIIVGRPFCRRLIDSICGLTKAHYHVRISKGIRLDLQMWLRFFQNHNGVSVFHDRLWVSNADEQLFTDSAAAHGFGIYFKGHWTYAKWPLQWYTSGITDDITTLELFPILVALHVWGDKLKNKKIRFMCDNMAVVNILNSMTSKSGNVMTLVRRITLLCLEYNMVIKANHIQGVKNNLCDALSRFQFQRFRQLAPEADPEPQPMPSCLWKIFDEGS